MFIELSIIIVAWNGEKVIKKCLDSIFGEDLDFDFEVIVVDNGSKDKTKAIIRKDFGETRLIENEENLGFAAANNLGIREAVGRYVLLLNQDVVLASGTLAGMLKFLKKNGPAEERGGRAERAVGAVAPKLVYPDGRVQASLRPFPTPANVIKDSLTGGKWHERFYDYSKSQLVDQPMAACLMVKKEVLERIGGFDADPRFFLYFNDVDLSFRIAELGLEHYFLADLEAIHHHGQSARRWPELRRLRAWGQGLYYFLVKHYAKERIWLKALLGVEVFLILGARILAETGKVFLRKN